MSDSAVNEPDRQMDDSTTDEPDHQTDAPTANDNEQEIKSKIDEIRRGFATQKYYTSHPKSKKFSGAFWRDMLQIFEKESNEVVKDAYYCSSCDEVIVANARGGTAKLNRHVKDHTGAKERIERVKVAELVRECVRLGIKYGKEVSMDYVLRTMPKPKSGSW